MVGRAGRRDRALREDDDCRLLQPLGRQEASKFAEKYECKPRRLLRGDTRATRASRRSSTPRRMPRTSRRRAPRRPRASTCSSTSRSPTPSPTRAPSPRRAARRRWCSRSAISGDANATSASSRQQIDEGEFGKLVNAEANISRDRLGKIDLNSWRYQAAGMPGGVMLQIGIHYTDVLEYLLGPVKAVSGRFVQLVLPGRQPGRRQPGPRARERRAVDAQRELRLGRRVLPDEHLRQGSHRLLRPAQRAAPAEARIGQGRKRLPSKRTTRSPTSWTSSPPRCAARPSPRWTASARPSRSR